MNNKLYDHIIDERNIYSAIYSIESYVFEKALLCDNDIDLYSKLTDKYNFIEIESFIKKCRDKLIVILNEPDVLFDVKVYFKLKKLDENQNEVYRPIHSADLLTQVCMVALLNIIMFDDTYGDNSSTGALYNRHLSSLSNLIPSNFYGNLPSVRVETIFQSWKHKYQEYSDAIIEKYREYSENKRYDYEVSLDFKEFFPSIDPKHIYSYIIDKLSVYYSDVKDLEILKIAVFKLLYCNLINVGSSRLIENYYGSCIVAPKYYTKGIPQGLPQGYYFGNICMIELSKLISEFFEGDALYYVDDSVIYTKYISDFNERIISLNERIGQIKWSLNQRDTFFNQYDSILEFHNKLGYKIELHVNGKSIISRLGDAHWGLSQLRLLAGETYNINNALFLSIDEIEDTTTISKLEKIIEVIDNELKWVDEKILRDSKIEKGDE